MKIALISGNHRYPKPSKYTFNLFECLHNQDRDINMLYCETPGACLQFDRDSVEVLRQRFRWPYMGKNYLPMYYYFPGKVSRGYDIYHISHSGLSKVAKPSKRLDYLKKALHKGLAIQRRCLVYGSRIINA